jgi:folate-binding protein YgfZ
MAGPFAALPGAVVGEGIDAGVPAHYGSPLAEQRALESGHAIVDLSSRGVIGVTGPDRLSWLDSMTSQALKALRPGESAEALLLDPAGHVEHDLHLLDDGETSWLLVEGSDTDAVLGFLQRMRFMLRVDPVDRTPEFATIGFIATHDAPVVDPAVGANGVPLIWRDPWASVTVGGHQYARPAAGHPGEEYRWAEALVPRSRLAELAALATAGGVAVAGTMAAEALRIAAWRPRLADADERTIPHELDWLRTAVHLNKGCYRGQETVAKVHNLGHPPRRLVFLHLDGSESPVVVAGDDVLLSVGSGTGVAEDGAGAAAAERVVGRVTSVAQHHELGPIALAVVKRSTDPAADLVVRAADGTLVAAAQELIVPVDAGAEVDVPRIPRLGAVSRAPRKASAG